MGAGRMIPPNVERFISVCLYILGAMFGLFILCIWCIVILNVAQVIEWPRPMSLRSALATVTVTVALLCASIWFGNRLGVIKLDPSTEKNIWRMLIAALLVSFGGAVAVSLPGSKKGEAVPATERPSTPR